jgi:hypothetical protein
LQVEYIYYLLFIAVIGMCAIGLNYFISRREHAAEVKSDRLRELRTQTFYVLDTITALKSAGCREDILDRLNQHALSLIEEITLLAPDSDLMTQVNNQKETVDRTLPGQAKFSNDKDLKRFQIYINYTEKLLKKMLDQNKISPSQAKGYGQELYWLSILVVAEAHIQQAHQLLNNGERLMAYSHLKHAKAVLVRSMVSQTKKQPKLDEIQPLIKELEPKKTVYEGTLGDKVSDAG